MIQEPLKIGIMGLSEGNGHPYSWSAILNGYNPSEMAGPDFRFPNIAAYLARRHFPEDQIQDARVTHVWTQDEGLSRHVAAACRIPHVVAGFQEMIGKVDAVIIARDDYEHHLTMGRPFLEAGVPLFIDKPLAVSVSEAENIFALERWPGQLFTCSALRYAQELFLSPEEERGIGPVVRIEGSTVKSWDKYAIHIIEPAIRFLGTDVTVKEVKRQNDDGVVTLSAAWENGFTASFQALGAAVKSGDISLRYIGKNGHIVKKFDNPFAAFKTALVEFIESARLRQRRIPKDDTIKTIYLIESGLRDDAR